MATVSRDGAQIAYDVAAPAGASDVTPTVVLLHNIFCDRRVYEHAFATLRQTQRVIAIDFRGHGDSTRGPRQYAVADLVGDVVAVLDREQVPRARVVGLSLGATVAMELALAHPARVERLVLLGADAAPDGGVASFRNALFCRLVRLLGLRGFLLNAVLATLFGRWFRTQAQAKDRFGVFRARIAAFDKRAAENAMRAWTGRRPLLAEVPALKLPVRIVVGEQDVSCPLPCGERLRAAIPGADLVRIADAGHTMTAEQPDETTAAIMSFVGAQTA